MQSPYRYLLPGLLLAVSSTVYADDPITDPAAVPSGAVNQDAANLTVYLQNLGKYFGYDLTQYCTTGGSCSNSGQSGDSGGASGSGGSDFSNTLLNPQATSDAQLGMFNSYLGALLGASSSAPLVPSDVPQYSQMNTSLAGQSFAYQNYSSASTSTVSVSPIIDQQTWQTDPVSQAILNLLSTPDFTYCQNNNTAPSCQPPFFREQILINVVGPLKPLATDTVFTPQQNIPLIPQLNIDSLLTPLMYTPSSASSGSGSSQNSTPTMGLATANSPAGLIAQTQAQQAMNFIRYATSAVNTLPLPSYSVYANLYNQASNSDNNTPQATQAAAQVKIAVYLTQLRSLAAQNSVAVSNLYYALSRRLPQNNSSVASQENSAMSSSDSKTPSSEAMNEFVMASWRLYNPAAGGANAKNQQWLTKINQGSAASVQKEIAVLLAEINYQLYLTRQQQERLLITQSMIMLQNSKLMPLSPTMDTGSTAVTPQTTGTTTDTSGTDTGDGA